MQMPGDDLQQRRFPRTIGTQYCISISGGKAMAHIPEYPFRIVPAAYFVQGYVQWLMVNWLLENG